MNEAIEADPHQQVYVRARGNQDPIVGESWGKDPLVSVELRIVEAAFRGTGRHQRADWSDVLLDEMALTWASAAARVEVYEGGQEIEPTWEFVLDGHHRIAEH